MVSEQTTQIHLIRREEYKCDAVNLVRDRENSTASRPLELWHRQ